MKDAVDAEPRDARGGVVHVGSRQKLGNGTLLSNFMASRRNRRYPSSLVTSFPKDGLVLHVPQLPETLAKRLDASRVGGPRTAN